MPTMVTKRSPPMVETVTEDELSPPITFEEVDVKDELEARKKRAWKNTSRIWTVQSVLPRPTMPMMLTMKAPLSWDLLYAGSFLGPRRILAKSCAAAPSPRTAPTKVIPIFVRLDQFGSHHLEYMLASGIIKIRLMVSSNLSYPKPAMPLIRLETVPVSKL